MNKNTKIIILVAAIVVLVLVVVLLVTSFANNLKDPNANATPTQAVGEATLSPTAPTPIVPKYTPTPSPDPTPSGELTVEDDVIEYENNTITYEYRDPVTEKVISETIKTDGNSTLLTVLEIVSQNIVGKDLAGGPLDPNSVTSVADSVYVDLKSGVYSANLGASGELTMLTAIRDGYINNVPGIKKVYISVDGQNYASSHTEFTKNQPFTP